MKNDINNLEVTYEEVAATAKEIQENAKKHNPNALYQVRRSILENIEGWQDAGILHVKKPLNWWIDNAYAHKDQLELAEDNRQDILLIFKKIFSFSLKIFALAFVFIFSILKVYEFTAEMRFSESLIVHLTYYTSFIYIAWKTFKK